MCGTDRVEEPWADVPPSKLLGTGSAPISPEVLEFLKVALCCEMQEGALDGRSRANPLLRLRTGYGQTEGHGTAVKVRRPLAPSASEENSNAQCFPEDYFSNGTCGPPVACNEVKLVDVPDMGYRSTDTPNPRGEICIRGDNVISGCAFALIPTRDLQRPDPSADYKDPKKTEETIDSEGWLHSGDIAELDEHGRFKIIDRIKNLMKLSQGE